MIHALRILILVGWAAIASAQPTIQWQKTFGGSLFDQANGVKQTTEGGYIVAGRTSSNDGDVVGHHSGQDFWVLKLNSSGELQWKKALGGTQNEGADEIIQTSDGGYLVVGYAESNNFDVIGNHGGASDGWVVKLSASGSIQWQKPLGGSGYDDLTYVQQTNDNGYILCGYSDSSDGDVSENKGLLDFWIIKISETGILEWQKSYGGSLEDYAYSVKQTIDGGYIVVGEAASADGDITNSRGNVDFWILKLDGSGAMQWQRTYGSEAADFAEDVIQTPDHGYIVVGYVGGRNTGDVTGHDELGILDYWVIKIDSLGTLIWEKALGGTDVEWARTVVQAPNGDLFVVGATASIDGDVVGNDGGGECWLVKLSSEGDFIWQKTYGGTNPEIAYCLDITDDNGLVFAGFAWSTDGDLTGSENKGRNDFWVVKLSPESTSAQNTPHTAESLQISPNPARQYANIEVPTQENSIFVTFSDLLGRVVLAQEMENHSTLNTAALIPGVYFVTAQTDSGLVFRGKLEKIP